MKTPSREDIERIAQEALRTLPDELRAQVADVFIHVEDFPDETIIRDMALDSPFDLLGLYQGVPLDQKSISHTPDDLDRIFLYRRPILDYGWEAGEDLSHLVRHVLIHEIGHHFGLSDDDMERLEAEG